jgi:hypothetical protein
MKDIRNLQRLVCLFSPVALLAVPGLAAAVELRVVPQLIHQSGTSGAVYIGHTVNADTPFNRILAGGSYTVTCNDPATSPLSGQRTASRQTGLGPTPIVVTIPEWLPSLQSIPGFSAVSPDTELSCTYAWTARAVESGYTISLGVISIPIGNGERTEGGTIPFTMYKPDRTDDGCIKN